MFHAKTSHPFNLYALIKKDGGLSWIDRGRSTKFTGEADALARICQAARDTDLGDRRPHDLSAILYEMRPLPKDRWHENGFGCFGNKYQFIPDDFRARKAFVLEAIVSTHDLRDGFALIYAKCEHGWLATPKGRGNGGHFNWSESFADAKAFGSIQEAKAACAPITYASSVAYLTAQALFTQVELPAELNDDGARGLKTAIEARDIRADLEKARSERMLAWAASEASANTAPRRI